MIICGLDLILDFGKGEKIIFNLGVWNWDESKVGIFGICVGICFVLLFLNLLR